MINEAQPSSYNASKLVEAELSLEKEANNLSEEENND